MNEHPFDEHLAAHAVDALEADQSAAIEAHLASCESCRGAVAEFRETAALLAVTVPRAGLPTGMRERVLATALATESRHAASASAVQSRHAARAPAAVRGPAGMVPWLLSAASLVLALGLGAALLRERNLHEQLMAAHETAESSLAERDSLLARNAALLERVMGPDVVTTTLAATGAPPSMRLFWDRAEGVIIVSARRLAPAPAGRTYQLWGIGANGVPVSLGTFGSQADGAAVTVLTVSRDASFEVSAVTDEPEGGSPQPTTAPFLVGRWPAAT